MASSRACDCLVDTMKCRGLAAIRCWELLINTTFLEDKEKCRGIKGDGRFEEA